MSQTTSLCTAPSRGERPWCCLEVQQHLRKDSSVYYVGKPALIRVLPLVRADLGPTSWCREGFPSACHDLLSHIPIIESLALISVLLSLWR